MRPKIELLKGMGHEIFRQWVDIDALVVPSQMELWLFGAHNVAATNKLIDSDEIWELSCVATKESNRAMVLRSFVRYSDSRWSPMVESDKVRHACPGRQSDSA